MKTETAAWEILGEATAPHRFLQPVDAHDRALLRAEAEEVLRLTGRKDWCLIAVPIRDWDRDLTPWEAPPVFGERSFGAGAGQTLHFLTEQLIPSLERNGPEGAAYYLCGYSLAGLFALWAVCESGRFAGAAAASPSLWYPGWTEYARTHAVKAEAVYLSLGDREEKTRHPVMARVGEAVRLQFALLSEAGIRTHLRWEEGNHFRDSEKRTARGIAWLLEQSDRNRT